MKRPVGVILSCAVLAIIAVLQLCGTAVMTFGMLAMRHAVPGSGSHAELPPPPNFVFVFLAGFIVLGLLMAAWCIVTLVGLIGLRNWARYSVLVIGGCLTVVGGFAVLGAIFAATIMPQAAPNNVPPHTMQAILAFSGFLYAIVVAVGVWWLIYFNQRKTKAYFLPNYGQNPTMEPLAYSASGYPAAPIYAGASLAPPPAPGRLSHVPTPIIVLACLFLLGALSCLLMALLPIPGFFFGSIIFRPLSSMLYLTFAVVSGAVGIGFLRLDNWSRALCYAYLGVGVVNFFILITPWGQARYVLYNKVAFASLYSPGPTPPSPFSNVAVVVLMCVVMVGVNAGVMWILQRYRYAFLKEPPPAPDPLDTPLTF